MGLFQATRRLQMRYPAIWAVAIGVAVGMALSDFFGRWWWGVASGVFFGVQQWLWWRPGGRLAHRYAGV